MTYTDADIAAAVETVREFREQGHNLSFIGMANLNWGARIHNAYRTIAEAYIERLDQPAQETR